MPESLGRRIPAASTRGVRQLKCHSLKLSRSLRSLCVLAECSNISMDEVVSLNLDLVSNGAAL